MYGKDCTCPGIRPSMSCPRHGWTPEEAQIELNGKFKATQEGEAFLKKLYHDQAVAGVIKNSEMKASSSICFENLRKIKRDFDRQNMFYVMASEHIPDDAVAILMVRPQDAAKMKEKGMG